MSFLETETAPSQAAQPIWPALDPAQRNEVVALLARLIAKTIEKGDLVDPGARDECTRDE